jgi:hypothetical protein
MLNSPAWPLRLGSAQTLIAIPGGPPKYLLPKLHSLINDMRGEESWPRRLQVAALLINDRNRDVSQRTIQVTTEALDYATQSWYALSRSATAVRREASLILGQLEPLYHDQGLFDRLIKVLKEDNKESVRDSAYSALLQLAAIPTEK